MGRDLMYLHDIFSLANRKTIDNLWRFGELQLELPSTLDVFMWLQYLLQCIGCEHSLPGISIY